ncbi:MAG: hypothetical protein AAF329_17260 [Cyanobacteria bacterium P01_A01_bin.17]
MTLKLKVEDIDSVDEKFRDLYEKKDGAYVLKLDGAEDTGALKRAKDHEKEARKKAEESLKALRDELDDLKKSIDVAENEKHKKKGDIEALEKSWAEKYEKLREEFGGKLSQKDTQIETLLVDSTARQLAGQLAVEGSADALYLPIKSRLAVAERDGKLTTAVLGDDGKPSAATIDELKQEFTGNAAYAPLIAASKGSGSGANGSQNGSGAPKKYSEMTEAEHLALFRKNPQEFERLRDAEAS